MCLLSLIIVVFIGIIIMIVHLLTYHMFIGIIIMIVHLLTYHLGLCLLSYIRVKFLPYHASDAVVKVYQREITK